MLSRAWETKEIIVSEEGYTHQNIIDKYSNDDSLKKPSPIVGTYLHKEQVQKTETPTISKDDEELLKFLESSKPVIHVIGTGGGGCNTLNRMYELNIEGAKLMAVNTDVQHLLRIKAEKKVLIGKNLTRGLGAGSNPNIGENAAKESIEEVTKLVEGGSMTFITCGMGGGTGTGSIAVIAEAAKKQGSLTVGVVTLPFASEGRTRMQNAIEGLNKLKKHVDTVIVIPNDKLLTLAPDLPLNTAFKISDEVLAGAVKGIVELVTRAGMVNLDFADLKTILSGAGCAVVGIGEASIDAKPDERAMIAVETALNSPLLDVDISTSDRALVNIMGGEDMTLKESELIVREISNRISPASHIIWGARVEKDMKKTALRILVVIAGTKCPDYNVDESVPSSNIELDLGVLG